MCPPDKDECLDGTHDCGKHAKCKNTVGGYNCVCKKGYTGDGKNCFEAARCTLWGDPHYTTFDGEKYNFQGLCKYRLVEPCTDIGGIPDFNVITKNKPIKKPGVTVTKYAHVKVYGFEIEITKSSVTVNGAKITPPRQYKPAHADWKGSYMKIKSTTLGMELVTDFGLIVKALDRAQYDIHVPKELRKHTCGLCGDNNGIAGDGFVLPNGTRVDDPVLFADEWRTHDNDPACKDKTPPPVECNRDTLAVATQQCNAMKDVKKFGSCLSKIGDKVNELIEACIYDVCREPTFICQNFKMFETMCEEDGVPIVWRTPDLCPLVCGPNSHYEADGPVCPATCSDPNPQCSEAVTTAEGCQCNDGYVLSGLDCVLEKDCGCSQGDKYLASGETFMSPNCQFMCECKNGDILCETPVSCHKNGKCATLADGSSECRCKKGFQGTGLDCFNVDECDGPHDCDDNAVCIDGHGSYSCTCLAGFTGDGYKCEDADECKDNTDTCSPFATCINEVGSYSCICKEGYVSDAEGKICVESVPEEPEIPEECNPRQQEQCMECADCKPLPGGHFTCVCPPGTVGDGMKGEAHTGCSKPLCSEGWLRHDDGCYKVFDKPETFEEGEKECQAQGGHLASIIDEATVEFLKNEMETLGHDEQYWIGYTDRNMEGIFVWKDNSASDFQKWAAGEPTKKGSRTKDCVSFGKATSHEFVTKKCDIEMGFVCRKALELKPCPRGWVHFDGSCYMSSSKPVPWYEAYVECVARGSDLTSISSRIENVFIKEGVIPKEKADLWIGGNLVQGKLMWAEVGQLSTYTDWAKKEPKKNKPCVLTNDNLKWKTEKCSKKKGFICERKVKDQIQCPGVSRLFDRCLYLTEPSIFDGNACVKSGGEPYGFFAHIFQNVAVQFLRSQPDAITVRLAEKTGALNSRSFTYWDNSQPDPKFACAYVNSISGSKWYTADCNTQNPTLCAAAQKPCSVSADCTVENSKCHLGQCRCKSGFRRNSNRLCEDIPECAEGTPCGDNQQCIERDGGYDCTCNSGFQEFGDACIPAAACTLDTDCNTRAKCINSVCECNSGYEGDGKSSCHNVDECLEGTNNCDSNSDCMDTDGGYECVCKIGYVKDEVNVCVALPRNCEDIRVKDSSAISGSYEIDADGPGGCSPFTVSCIMREDIGITVIPSDSQTSRPIRSADTSPESVQRPVTYKKTDEQINCLVETSKFCYQNVQYECSGGAKLQDVSSITLNTEKQTVDKCACGMLGTCSNPKSGCNCDGTPMGDQIDNFKFINKEDLPIRLLAVAGVGAGQKAATSVGPLMCAQKQFDIPLNCDDAMRNYGVNKNGEVLVDIDGPDGDDNGNLPPFLVYCDVTSYPDTGITVIKPKNPVFNPSEPGVKKIKYPATDEAILKLVEKSDFCSQGISYECQNSGISDGATSWTSLDGKLKNYAGYRKKACGCGLTKSCEKDDVKCNCDIKDGKKRVDFGTIIDKKELPVGSVKLTDINADAKNKGKATVAALQCGPKQFGIPRTCQQWRELGYTEDYTYLIDPDGADGNPLTGKNVAPFPVVCDMVKDRPIGITIVGHNTEDDKKVDDSEAPGSYSQDITYTQATTDQLDALTEASSYCSQQMALSCIQATLKNLDDASSPNAFWVDNNGNKRRYFAGAGDAGEVCQCGLNGDCKKGQKCNCDANLPRKVVDEGVLTNKKDLPIRQVNFGDTGDDAKDQIEYKVGKLVCYALYETCHDIYQAYTSEPGLSEPVDGRYVIDPDGVLNEDPFLVDCLFPSITVVNLEKANYHKLEDSPENLGPKAQTVQPVYIDATIPQLEALTKVSGFCRQYMKYTCQHAPLSKNVYWASRGGQKQKGWAGNNGGDKCACGEVGKCEGGRACNCDVNDNIVRQDDGWLINKQLLPVTEISFGLSKENIPSEEKKMAEYHLGALECSNEQFGIFKDCQGLRNSLTPNNEVRSNAEIIDPDQTGGLDPFVVYCEMLQEPPIGITVIPADVKSPVKIPATEEVVKTITYTSGSVPQLTVLTEVSQYCTQEMAYLCKEAALSLDGDLGLYSRDGKNLAYWSGSAGDTGCDNKKCKCDGSSSRRDTGNVLDKAVLPISSVKLGVTTGSRKLGIGELRCSGLFRTCHEILLAGANLDPNWNGMYAIDSDGSGPLAPFSVKCDFLSEPGIGITVIDIEEPSEISVTKSPLNQKITYVKEVSPQQAHQLAQVSGFCLQGMKYTCKLAPLMSNDGGFLTFDGSKSKQFAGADNSDRNGCACVVLGTCPPKSRCRCDAAGPMETEEGDFVTNRDILPVTGVKSKGLSKEGAEASFSVGNLRCGPKPFGLPKDCQEALEFGYKTGEALIWPSKKVDPFIVYCDMDSYPEKGVTILKTDVKRVNVDFPSEVPVVYVGPTLEQVEALVEESERCYLPMKFECNGTKFSDSFSIQTSSNDDISFFGSARRNRMCSCGEQNRCGGQDGRALMEQRNCNCDVGDDKNRVDAGVFGNQGEMPVKSIKFEAQPENAGGKLSLGRLYCVDKPIDLDECAIGFNDCHKNADCVNRNGYYQCVCKEGFRGKGRKNVWANGRECYDDNECALKLCPKKSKCKNTKGSYSCTCKSGYTMNADNTECVDVNECTSNPCFNAESCINQEPGFTCKCPDGFVGDGVTCTDIESCSCTGGSCSNFAGAVEDVTLACNHVLFDKDCAGGKIGLQYEDVPESGLQIKLINIYGIQIFKDNTVKDEVGVFLNLPFANEVLTIQAEGSSIIVTGREEQFSLIWNFPTVTIHVSTEDSQDGCGICSSSTSPRDCVTVDRISSWAPCKCTDVAEQPPPVDAPVCENIEQMAENSRCWNSANAAERTALVSKYSETCQINICLAIREIFMDCRGLDASSAQPDVSKYFAELASQGCDIPCSEEGDMHFKFCGPACPETCGQKEVGCIDEVPVCIDGCYCNSDLILNDDQCTSADLCGCVMDGMYLPIGESVVNEDCTKKCECGSSKSNVTCTPLTCEVGTTCAIQKGVRDCHCSEGYSLKNGKCQDVNECDDPSVCVGSQCENSVGSYKCTCTEGFEMKKDVCEDINECLNGKDDCNADTSTCSNKDGGFDCICNKGFKKNSDGDCEDVDECASNRHDCDRASTLCSNAPGSFTCDCKLGYSRLDDKTCKDIDECTETPNECIPNSKCENSPGSFSCKCDSGFRKNDQQECEDIPECKEQPGCPEFSSCVELVGSYRCDCNKGYVMNEDTELCEDVDECKDDASNNCDAPNSDCTNTQGSYECGCQEGFIGDGVKSCDDDNECSDPLTCGYKSECENLPGSYKCKCEDGFESKTSNNMNCEDVEECEENKDNCDVNAICENTVGDFKCSCNSGYSGNGETCTDIDECVSSPCGSSSTCENVPGSYKCGCLSGYTKVGSNCVNDDECSLRTHDCDVNAACVDNPGSFTCNCNPGYTGEGTSGDCTPIDECAEREMNTCTERQDCVEKAEFYDCVCKPGFEPAGKDCVDIPECNRENKCDVKADCKELEGSYSCTCKDGYSGDGEKCEDVDECKTQCNGPGQKCENLPGTYRCTCSSGYEQQADLTCKDIDECETAECSDSTECKNSLGSFECVCKEGFGGEGGCEDEDECAAGQPCLPTQLCENTNGGFICSCQEGFSLDDGECKDDNECESGLVNCVPNSDCVNTEGSYECVCKTGFVEETDGSCKDINECLDGSQECSPNGNCQNLPGSFTCDDCKDGYKGNGKICDDEDECELETDNCSPQASCQNTDGSFICSCNDGYKGSGELCSDIEECAEDLYECVENSHCVNTIPFYDCECDKGFSKEGDKCVDIDDCASNPCIGGECADGVNSFECSCENGYRLHIDGITCLAPDDCTYDPTICDEEGKEVCKADGSKRKCKCRKGYKMGENGCEDVNECKKNVLCGPNMKCQNEVGGYDCICRDGYKKIPILSICKEIDECAIPVCPPFSTCEDGINSYTCNCNSGYSMVTGDEGLQYCKEDDQCKKDEDCPKNNECVRGDLNVATCKCKPGFDDNCNDINECAGPNECSPDAECENTPGSYVCNCLPGFNGNGIMCTDVNECTSGANDCGENTECENIPGGYLCKCLTGYNGHCDACQDINECATGLAECSSHSECVNSPGSYSCQCFSGFELVDGKCRNINECQLGVSECPSNSACRDTKGSYVCSCTVGYQKSDSNLCENVNECESGEVLCGDHATCYDTEGSFVCQCDEGYGGNGQKCIELSPTACGSVTCHATAICVTSSQCQCPQGYNGNPIEGEAGCSDIDECTDGNECDPNAACENSIGSYTCKCNPGFEGDGRTCKDESPAGCLSNADCGFNSECQSDGSCACYPGYAGQDGFNCQDIDECENDVNSQLCGSSTYCYNKPGGHECVCRRGYDNLDTSTKPNTCSNVDECTLERDDCGLASCVDTDGSYLCECPQGKTFNGLGCNEQDTAVCDPVCGDREYCNEGVCQCQPGFSGQDCTAVDTCSECHEKSSCTFSPEVGSSCLCNEGYEGNGIYCQDINECATGEVICGDNAYCINVPETAYCNCHTGYAKVDEVCKPEVSTTDPCGCGANGVCEDLESMTCSCDSGFVFKSEATSNRCRDLDECSVGGYCHIKSQCTNSVGSYTCTCLPGYYGDGKNLCERDGCTPNPCGLDAKCLQTGSGGFVCVCPDGYDLIGGRDCVRDDADCSKLGDCGENAHCVVDERNEVSCECNTGYEGDGVGCVDKNECDLGQSVHKCAVHATCYDFDGGHSCSCNTGYEGNGHYCQQINECKAGTHTCSAYANCNDLIGSYFCECKKGYEGDGITCSLKPGCTATKNCDENASCQLTDAGYKCRCDPGYFGDGITCKEVNECEDPVLNTCKPLYNVKCENLDLGHRCVCLDGFQPVSGVTDVCEDMDECKDSDVDCGENSNCQNNFGSYECECKSGYTGTDGRNCQDINECKSPSENDCDANAECTNEDGSYTCTCNPGYSGDGLSCNEIDECDLKSSACPANSECVDGPNSYSCECLNGFTKIDENTCQDINECGLPSDKTCDVNAVCDNTEGSYTCSCNEGYRGNGRQCTENNPCDDPGACHKFASCTNNNGVAVCQCNPGYTGDGVNSCDIVNECEAGTDNCLENADCINENPGYKCECKSGYYGDGVTICKDINECDPNTELGGLNECDGDTSTCENTDGGYNCPCIQGYRQDGPRKCIRIDLCDTDANNCHEKASCEDVARRVVCTCNDGFEGDGLQCEDIDECKLNTDDCSGNSECVNNDGGFKCECQSPGYKYVGDKCVDINECDLTPGICTAPATCANNVGSFKCVCPEGFNFNEETKTCKDINECNQKPCPATAECLNNEGGFSCTCPEGYRLIGNKCVDKANCDLECAEKEECNNGECVCKPGYERNGEGACSDINECADDSTCDLSVSTCENSDGSFVCKCKTGFRGNYPACVDVDECSEGANTCDDNEVCKNSVGAYECECRSGYIGSPCRPINECLNPAACPSNSVCKDKDDGFNCICNPGFKKNADGLCIDVNECQSNNPCDTERGFCENNEGGYVCKCNSGYFMNGDVCTDFDECKSDSKCNVNAGCSNTAGSYVCVCKVGYSGNGISCTEIDECEPEPCGKNTICQDEVASFSCICKNGYSKVGDECKDINECAEPNMCGENEFCRNKPATFECLCNPGYEKNDLGRCKPINPCLSNPCAPAPAGRCEPNGIEAKCSCSAGYSGENCEDIDECKGSRLCSGGSCVNVPGTFYCECPKGFELDNFVCEDINECTAPEGSSYAADCGPREYCVNEAGSYSCQCKQGYVKRDTGCEDVNECDDNRCDANADCFNVLGSFRCDCRNGFTGTGLSCTDANECELYPGVCGPMEGSICADTAGSYRCSCLQGYKLVNNKCQDIDDCLVAGVCGKRGKCGNIDGGYICSCPEGFIFVNGDCQNIDECVNSVATCNPNADCVDLIGSYECKCKEGYRGDGKTCTRICGPGACPKQSTCTVSGDQAVCECKCNGPRCSVPGQVCGTDAVTYGSESQLIIAACEQSKKIKKDYDGVCQMTCDNVVCPNHKSCIVSSNTKRPTCVCHRCTEAEENTGKLCTDKKKEFDSLCVFKKWQCRRPYDSSVVANYGSCPAESGCQLSDFGPWSPCSVSCGEGTKTKSRTVIFADAECPPLVQTAKCYEPACPNSQCEVCPGVGQVCVERDGKPQCVCPDCSGLDRDLVCGQIGDKEQRTYINRCVLQRKACKANKIFTEIHPGRCGDANPSEPLSCSVVTHFGNVRDADGCKTTKPHSVNKCSGGCGDEADDCCQPETARYKKAQVSCPNGQVKLTDIPLITSCKCGKDAGAGAEEARTTFNGFKFIYN